MAQDTFQAIEDLQKDLMSKSNIKEVLSLMKNKTGKEFYNRRYRRCE